MNNNENNQKKAVLGLQADLPVELVENLRDVLEVIEKLIGSDGCPWDKKQTPQTLCDYLIEEVFEFTEAVHSKNLEDCCEEGGDVLFLLFFMLKLYSQKNNGFSLSDSLKKATEKMIRRHPHVFSTASFVNQEELINKWEQIKKEEEKEKKEKSDIGSNTELNTELNISSDIAEVNEEQGVFAKIPKGLPPLLRAYKIHAKAAKQGFTFDCLEDVEQQFEAEWLEWLDSNIYGDIEARQREFGDLLFTLVELGRQAGIKANSALSEANIRFIRRFSNMEFLAKQQGKDFSSLDVETKNKLWEEVKEIEKTNVIK